MAQKLINVGTAAGDGTGDKLRDAFIKVNANDAELYPSLGATNADNVILINNESEFPAQTATTITLQAGFLYFIGKAFSTLKNFVIEDNVTLESANAAAPVITYTGSGPMFSSANTNWTLKNIGLACPNGDLYAITGGIIQFLNIRIAQNVNIGSLTKGTGLTALITDIINIVNVTGQGMTFFGAVDLLSISRTNVVSSSATHIVIDLGTATFQTLEISDGRFFGVAGAVALKGLAGSANILSGNTATIESSTFNGIAMTPLSGIAISDVRYDFQNVDGLQDSVSAAETHLTSAETVTINTIGVFEIVNGTNWADDFSDRFTISAAGVVTYISEKDAEFRITASATVEKSGGGADEIEMRIRINSTDEVKTRSTTQNATPTGVLSSGIFLLTKDDTIRTTVANNNTTTNVIVDPSIIDVTPI